jgi:hypothetical protein
LAALSCPWVTFHIAQFAAPLAAEAARFDGPAAAALWRFGPDSPLGAGGLRTRIGDVWGGVALYTERAAAQAVIDAPAAHLGFMAGAVQSWHALLQPIAHRGLVNWLGPGNGAPTLAPAAADPGGLMVALTTAGYDALPPDQLQADLPRRADFLANVERVRAWYATLPGNLARGVFNFAPLGTDGLTFSVWRDDAAMMDAAYRAGAHRTQVDRYKAEKTADRTSFTRARLLAATGAWQGSWNSADLR